MKKHYKRRFLLLVLGGFISTSAWAKENPGHNLLAERNGPHKLTSNIIVQTVVSGQVTDENGEGMPGVTVVLEGAAGVGTVTNLDGNYRLEIPEGIDDPKLVFSFVGYLKEEVQINNRSVIDISLTPDIKSLEEVVVVGYGTQKKKDLTGSVTSVTAKDFNKGQMTTPDQLISGKVAGVNITSNGGAPGAGSQIRIRGGSSLSASNDPLIVIDGVPIDNASLSGSSNPLNSINPNDIESINVLKDASATAIYGSRASNGVIIVTTKKGSVGQKFSANFSTLHSISAINRTVDVLSADQYRSVLTDLADNGRLSEEQIALVGTADTDWQDAIFRNAYTMDHNLSLSGAYKTLPYRLSLGYLDQEGILKTSRFERTTGSLNLNPSFLNDHLKVNVNLKGTLSNSRFADEGAIGAAVTMDPTQPIYVEGSPYGGYFEWESEGTILSQATRNPLSMLEQRRDEGQVKRSIGNLMLDYKFHFLPELRANLNLGYDISESEGENLQPRTMGTVFIQGGSINRYEASKSNKLLDFYLNYAKDLKSIDSRIDVTGGYSYQSYTINNPNLPTLTLTEEADTISAPNPFKAENVLISFFGRVNYNLKEKYLLTATLRNDGSSRFAPENRWGLFPALALAWRINEEGFLADSRTVSDLKLRLGYGVTGQQDLGNDNTSQLFPYLPRYVISDQGAQYQFGDTFYRTYRPAGYDLNIKWEETVTYNAGLDFGFLNNRVSGSLDYYYRRTDDLLTNIPVATGTNLTNRINTNVGSLENRGLEAAVNVNLINTEKLSWEVGVNGTYNRNKITRLSNVDDSTSIGIPTGGISGGTGTNIQIHTVGYPINSFYVARQVYDEQGNPIEGVYADLNGDGLIDDAERYRYRDPAPRFYFGFNSQLNYQNWSLGFVFRGNIGNYVYNNINSNNGAYQVLQTVGSLRNMSANVLETGFNNYQYRSDYYVENASFLRLDNLNLAYNFGGLMNDKINLGLSANIQNAFVITNYTGLDPEIADGIDNNVYPRPRVFAIGLNVGF